MDRTRVLLVIGGIVLALAFVGLVLPALTAPPIACWLELRYALEPADQPARETAIGVERARLQTAGLREFAVQADGDGLLVRGPIREPRRLRAASPQARDKARVDFLAAECDAVRKLIELRAQLAIHKVDACGRPGASPGGNTYLQYAYDQERWRKAQAGQPVPGFMPVDYTPWYRSGPQETERLLLVAEPIVDTSMLAKVEAMCRRDTRDWYLLIHLDLEGTARIDAATSSATMQHERDRLAILLDGEVKSAPVVMNQLAGILELTGRFTREEAERLAAALNSGSLPCKLTLKSQQMLPPK